jgi:hypothetical protein
VVGGDRVTVAEVVEDAGDDPLLADAEVHLARDQPLVPQPSDLLLEPPAGEHHPVQPQEIRAHDLASSPVESSFGSASLGWTCADCSGSRQPAADGTIRLWPMPDLSKPPLHTLPHDELLAKLKSLTNLRAVRDPASDTGWKIEIGPFPGWDTVPEWNP